MEVSHKALARQKFRNHRVKGRGRRPEENKPNEQRERSSTPSFEYGEERYSDAKIEYSSVGLDLGELLKESELSYKLSCLRYQSWLDEIETDAPDLGQTTPESLLHLDLASLARSLSALPHPTLLGLPLPLLDDRAGAPIRYKPAVPASLACQELHLAKEEATHVDEAAENHDQPPPPRATKNERGEGFTGSTGSARGASSATELPEGLKRGVKEEEGTEGEEGRGVEKKRSVVLSDVKDLIFDASLEIIPRTRPWESHSTGVAPASSPQGRKILYPALSSCSPAQQERGEGPRRAESTGPFVQAATTSVPPPSQASECDMAGARALSSSSFSSTASSSSAPSPSVMVGGVSVTPGAPSQRPLGDASASTPSIIGPFPLSSTAKSSFALPKIVGAAAAAVPEAAPVRARLPASGMKPGAVVSGLPLGGKMLSADKDDEDSFFADMLSEPSGRGGHGGSGTMNIAYGGGHNGGGNSAQIWQGQSKPRQAGASAGAQSVAAIGVKPATPPVAFVSALGGRVRQATTYVSGGKAASDGGAMRAVLSGQSQGRVPSGRSRLDDLDDLDDLLRL